MIIDHTFLKVSICLRWKTAAGYQEAAELNKEILKSQGQKSKRGEGKIKVHKINILPCGLLSWWDECNNELKKWIAALFVKLIFYNLFVNYPKKSKPANFHIYLVFSIDSIQLKKKKYDLRIDSCLCTV